MANINNLFIKLLLGNTLPIEAHNVGKLINYCKSLSGDYTLNIEIVKQKVKVKMV